MEVLLTSPLACSITKASPRRNPNPYIQQKLIFYSHRRCFIVRVRPWDSNAETIRSQSFSFSSQYNNEGEDDDADTGFRKRREKRRRWWSDEDSSPFEEGFGGMLEEAIDSVWIFKVFRSYGWMLPAIILSLLLSTGPKAFLMALALPLGQSAVSLAFEKLFGRAQRSPRPNPRPRKKKPFASPASAVEIEEEEWAKPRETRKGNTGYRSWEIGNDGSSTSKGVKSGSSFNGWDELEDIRRKARAAGASRRTPGVKGKLSRRERRKDTPLFLRLLIAVFPFLGSWTKML